MVFLILFLSSGPKGLPDKREAPRAPATAAPALAAPGTGWAVPWRGQGFKVRLTPADLESFPVMATGLPSPSSVSSITLKSC